MRPKGCLLFLSYFGLLLESYSRTHDNPSARKSVKSTTQNIIHTSSYIQFLQKLLCYSIVGIIFAFLTVIQQISKLAEHPNNYNLCTQKKKERPGLRFRQDKLLLRLARSLRLKPHLQQPEPIKSSSISSAFDQLINQHVSS